MADSAAQIRYREEFISGFEQRQSLLRQTVTVEADIKGSSAVFLVADSGNAAAVTRGLNGLIPARASNLNQSSATLVEWQDLTRRTDFNIYTSQGNGRLIMQKDAMGVLNRRVDQDIIGELNSAAAVNDNGAAVTASLSLVMYGLVVLGNNAVPLDGNISAVITPAFYGYLMQAKEFASADFVSNQPFSDAMTMFRWAGVNFIVHPNLPGKATAAEKCFMYHKSAIGHACDMENVDVKVGVDEEQGYSWARASAFMGSKLLQPSGVFVMNHKGDGFAAQ